MNFLDQQAILQDYANLFYYRKNLFLNNWALGCLQMN